LALVGHAKGAVARLSKAGTPSMRNSLFDGAGLQRTNLYHFSVAQPNWLHLQWIKRPAGLADPCHSSTFIEKGALARPWKRGFFAYNKRSPS
jgi:hypothetical protein